MQNKLKRYYALDLLRGTAVFLMILAHSVYFYHNYSNKIITNLELIGNTVCFVSFLFVSGAVSYVAYLQKGSFHNSGRILKRIAVLIVSYYAISFFVLSREIIAGYGFEKFRIISDVLLFRNLPSYLEYIPPFIVFSVLILLLPRLFDYISRSYSRALLISAIFYLAGFFLYNISVPEIAVPWKAFLFGNEGYYRFPIFQYFPIFIAGLVWGRYTCYQESVVKKKQMILELISIFVIVILISLAISNFFNIDPGKIMHRWPPTISFLSIGLLSSFVLIYVFYHFQFLKKAKFLRDFLLLLGQNGFALFITHILVLYFYQFAGGEKTSSVTLFLIYFLLTLLFSLALATFIPFNYRFNLTFIRNFRDTEESLGNQPIYEFGEDLQEDYSFLRKFLFPPRARFQRDKRVIKKRHVLGGSLIALAASFVVFPSIGQEIDKNTKLQNNYTWWSDQYAYRMIVEIKNDESFNPLKEGDSIMLTLNHKEMVDDKKALADGSDIKIVYWTGKSYKDIKINRINSLNQTDTKLVISLADNIHSGQTDNNYFIYFGNPISEQSVKTISVEDKLKYSVFFGQVENYPVLLNLNKRWLLKEKDLTLNLNLSGASQSSIVEYQILETNSTGIFSSFLPENDYWTTNIDISSLKVGKYRIRARVTDGTETKYSQTSGFNISRPVLVSWTIDWEGYDAPNNYLNKMANIADKYGIPMTHFFNPRIYIAPDISIERQDYLTDWVKQRQAKKDEEIGMHLHMFYDFASDAGVEPLKEPNWGDRGDGYGVPTSNYSKEDFSKLIDRALWWFDQKNIDKPKSYRAGGWFADIETLKVLQDNGFLIDSSGRTYYRFGSNNISGSWDLTPTTKPYYPASDNQNKSSLDSNLNILEIPNNGADSYKFSFEEMKDRFDANYQGGINDEFDQVTFLTHPHWFNEKEQTRIDNLFNYVDQFNYQKDQGPVLYSTIFDIYQEYANQ